MKKKRICTLLFFAVLTLVLSSCHTRHVSDIRPNMTKEDAVSLWGSTDLITFKTVNGKTVETWEYHFAASNSVCWITFIENRVTNTGCKQRPQYYYPYPYGYYYRYPGYYYPYGPY